jgi:UDP-N-acetylglucosamine--N-acetylmuramyl-(pentapeptide) pyrophosphoryl-undecaprenol N-acetylglucosamine transferase
VTGTYACIAGGGTAGHVLPGLAIAEAMVEAGHDPATIRFVGSERGPDATLVPAAGFALHTVAGRGIPRKVSRASLAAAASIVVGVWSGIGLMHRLRPAVVVVLGGYASVPCTVGAVLWRIPMVVTEQNARASLASRLAGRFAKACAVPFEGTDLPRAVVTGNPVRPEILAVDRARDREESRRQLQLPPDRTVIGVASGSLGSTRVNQAVAGLAQQWADRDDLAIYHAVGARDWDAASDASDSSDPARSEGSDGDEAGLVYRRVRYEDHVERLYAAADIYVGRAGGSTVAELTVVGLGSVLVPLPIAPRDAQTANAEALVAVGAAVRVPDAELDAERLAAELTPLLSSPATLVDMATAAHSLAHPDAARRVADLAQRHARHG